MRMRLPGSRVSEWQENGSAVWADSVPLAHPGDPKRLSSGALAKGWVRLPVKHVHNERVCQSFSLALDSRLTPGERLRPLCCQPTGVEDSRIWYGSPKMMMLLKNKLVCGRFPVKNP